MLIPPYQQCVSSIDACNKLLIEQGQVLVAPVLLTLCKPAPMKHIASGTVYRAIAQGAMVQVI